jgi:uncharacterized membrane protein YeiB
MVSTYTRIKAFWEFTGLLLIFTPVAHATHQRHSDKLTMTSHVNKSEMHLFLHVKIHLFHKVWLRLSMINARTSITSKTFHILMVKWATPCSNEGIKVSHALPQCISIHSSMSSAYISCLVLYISVQTVWKGLNSFFKYVATLQGFKWRRS